MFHIWSIWISMVYKSGKNIASSLPYCTNISSCKRHLWQNKLPAAHQEGKWHPIQAKQRKMRWNNPSCLYQENFGQNKSKHHGSYQFLFHLSFDISGKSKKSVFDVDWSLGAGFHEFYAVLDGELLSAIFGYLCNTKKWTVK